MINRFSARKEIHKRKDFPLSIHPCHITDTFHLAPHFHDHFEILYLTHGNATIQIGENSYDAIEGDILFANMYQIHSAYYDNMNPATIHAIVFHGDMLDPLNIHDYYIKYIKPFLSGEKQFPPKLETDSELYAITKASLDVILKEGKEQSTAYEVFIKTEIERMFANFYRYRSNLNEGLTNQISQNNRELLSKLDHYIQKHYHTLITLDDISSHLGMNKSYFCRLIKKLTGRSFTQFLNIYRIKEAELLLQKTSYPVSLIAEKAGFTNHSYFNRTFKEYKGMTPSRFRKNIEHM